MSPSLSVCSLHLLHTHNGLLSLCLADSLRVSHLADPIAVRPATRKSGPDAISTTLEYMKRRQALRTLEAQQEAHNSERALLEHGLRRAQMKLEEERKARVEDAAAVVAKSSVNVARKASQRSVGKLARLNRNAKSLRRQLGGLKMVRLGRRVMFVLACTVLV